MKIGIDISMLVYQGSGVANYTYNLVKHLLKYDKENEYRLFYSSFRRPKNFYYLDQFRKLGAKVYDYRFPPSFLKLVWGKHHLLPVEWIIGKVDVFHSSDFLRPPLLQGTKGITTIHDLTWKIFPQYHTDEIVKGHERKLKKTIEYKDIIIVDSQNTKKDLLKYYPSIQKTNTIQVIYPGIDERFKVIKDQKKIIDVLKKYHVLPTTSYQQPITIPNFLLYVGAIEPRKNLIKAIEVFHQLVTSHQQLVINFYIVGRAGWKNEEVFQSIKRLKLEDKVRFVGYVEDDDLVYFYNACKIFIYLSKYEGFGLPPLEALACGTKIIVGKNSSLQEILPKKYLVDVNDQNKILKKLKELIFDKGPVFFQREKFLWRNYLFAFCKLIKV